MPYYLLQMIFVQDLLPYSTFYLLASFKCIYYKLFMNPC